MQSSILPLDKKLTSRFFTWATFTPFFIIKEVKENVKWKHGNCQWLINYYRAQGFMNCIIWLTFQAKHIIIDKTSYVCEVNTLHRRFAGETREWLVRKMEIDFFFYNNQLPILYYFFFWLSQLSCRLHSHFLPFSIILLSSPFNTVL